MHNENALFLSTAPPSLSFWGAKKKVGGGKPQAFACTRRLGNRAAARRVVVPYGRLREVSSTTPASWRIAKRLRRRGEGGVEIDAKTIKKGQSPQPPR